MTKSILRQPHLSYLKEIYDRKYIKKIEKIPVLRVGTDCSGIEAPIMALTLMGIDFIHEFSCDNDKNVLESIKANYNPKKIYEDIFERDLKKLPNIDMYVLGFPCQSFSTIGQRTGKIGKQLRKARFSKKGKGNIFFEGFKVIKAKKPKFFILENVKGLITHNKGETFQIIKKHLKSLKKYNIYIEILNTKDFNIPQNRNRLYIIGIKKSMDKGFKFPKNIKSTVSLNKILSKNSDKNKLISSKKKILKNKIKEKKIKKGDTWIINLNSSGGPWTTAMKNISPCVITTCNMFYLTNKKRFLTPRECLRLQGFPNQFKIVVSKNKAFKQAGNSMSVNVISFILKNIIKSIF